MFLFYSNNAIPPEIRLMVTLRFLATGDFFLSIGDISGISKTSAVRIVDEVVDAILDFKDEFIKMPETDEEKSRTKLAFYNLNRFPRVIGIIDGTHVKIQSTGKLLIIQLSF